jgi:hypothetical protein
VALFLLHARYQRTCAICGERWVVSRRQAAGSPGRAGVMRRMRGTPSGTNVGVIGQRFTARVEVWQAFRRCPVCGVDDFTQSPV